MLIPKDENHQPEESPTDKAPEVNSEETPREEQPEDRPESAPDAEETTEPVPEETRPKGASRRKAKRSEPSEASYAPGKPSNAPAKTTPPPSTEAEPAPEDAESSSAADPDGVTMDELMAAYEDTLADLREGEVVRGVVVGISGDEILVDVGYKSEGPIDRREFGPDAKIDIGDEVDVYLEKKEDQDGIIVLSKEKADFARTWEKIRTAFEDEEVIKGKVVARIKGGLEVDIGARGFLPASQVALRPVRDLESLVGKQLEMRILKINRRRRNIVLSRKVVLQERREKLKEELVSELEEGQIREGEVKNITDFGAFIDLGGIDGLLHITDMSWGRISHPGEMLQIGDKVKILVLNFDRERERVSLGLKQLTPHPWKDAAQKYSEGTIIRGKVVNMTDYGAFVEIEDGIEGLIHISEMSWTQRIRHPSQMLSIGDLVNAKVLNLDTEKQRISLGLKQTEEDPWETIAEHFPRGTRLMGRVRNITDFGAFVEVDEGIDGLVHISDMSWVRRVRHPSEIVQKGDEIEVVVLNVDTENRRISLGMKQLTEDPWEHIEDYIFEGAYVEGTVVRMARFGAIIELSNGIEALLHISEIVDAHVPNVEDILDVGEHLTCKVININREERKVNLSLKAYNADMGIGPEDDPVMQRLIKHQEAGSLSEREPEPTPDDEDFEPTLAGEKPVPTEEKPVEAAEGEPKEITEVEPEEITEREPVEATEGEPIEITEVEPVEATEGEPEEEVTEPVDEPPAESSADEEEPEAPDEPAASDEAAASVADEEEEAVEGGEPTEGETGG
ncbi:MAG: 30S ribosomal protein S1 [bacterium]|nr:30S ribosomal protein S1 [bacterium]